VHDVGRVGLEEVGGELLGPLDHELGGGSGGRATDLQGLRATGSATSGDVVGVAVADLDAVERDARAVRDQHRPRGVVALPVGRGAGAHDGPALGGDLDRAVLALAQHVGDLDVGRHADAELAGAALGAPLGLPGAQVLVAGCREHGVEHGGVVAAVVAAAGGGAEGEGVGLEQVLAPDLDGVHADLGGEAVDHALDGGGGLGPSCTAVRADRGGVGDDRADADTDVVDGVATGRHHPGHVGQDAAGAGVGAPSWMTSRR
jgi:hypothetical protein